MRPPQLRYKLFPSIYLSHLRVELMQLSDFSFFRSLIHSTRLLCDFCSSDQSFVSGFLQIPPRDGHPCLQLYAYHCRSHSGLAPVRVCPCWANKKNRTLGLCSQLNNAWQRPTLTGPKVQLPSALRSLTAVFGMGTGVSFLLPSPHIVFI